METNKLYNNKSYYINLKNQKKGKIKIIKKAKKEKNKSLIIILPIFIIIFILYLISKILKHKLFKNKEIKQIKEKKEIIYKYDNIIKPEIELTESDYLKEMEEFIYIIANGTLINSKENFHKSENPKISIVISVYNGEGLLIPGLRSVQNQDFLDIEIIIVDDGSQDNSVNLIKNLMKEDPRIMLLENKINKGILYTKGIGVLNAKGKYVMTLDVDDVYSSRYAFSKLYFESETNNLDILGFASMGGGINIHEQEKFKYHYYDTPVIFQPKVTEKIYAFKENGQVERTGLVIWNYFFRTNIFIKSINQIDKKYMDINLQFNDDLIFFFLITRNSKNLKQIKRVFYYHLSRNKNEATIAYRYKIKNDNKNYKLCFSNIIYVEFLLSKTNSTIEDKKIASFELNKTILNNYKCKYNINLKEQIINLCKLFLDNNYIEEKIKNEINSYLKIINNK